ncbi:hypothetical protein GMLC_06180 [Geomonas limicola]|uniref:TVP38/TMEM64 family membrane protein n=1 Tax=Geomonas limicola TaxID=2740186 RepID=A0A6V8N6Y1_9BACT|nr:TVP38/TMEM64 family protein [Geomonas limicola]GFO67039.1 hypothetical protein GMLC_06180 [Geomonas limicola]
MTHKVRLLVALAVLVFATLAALLLHDVLSLARLREHRELLLGFIEEHYLEAVLCFVALYLATALFLPGALVLTLTGGMLFGTLPTVLYVNLGATSGAVLAFLAGRYLVGDWVQRRYREPLARLNRELAERGGSYLLTLRILPVLPFFVVNYCAGISNIRLRTFIWATSLGLLPGSCIYAYLGTQLRQVKELRDLATPRILEGLMLMALLALAPVLRHHLMKKKDPAAPG